MKACVSYSESHEKFLKDWFLPSFPFEPGLTLVVEKLQQVCTSGRLFSDGWREQMILKQHFINRCLHFANDNELVLFSDVDIKFYGPIFRDFGEIFRRSPKDIYFMKDHNSDATGRCGGFFVVRVSKVTRQFFNDVLAKLTAHKSAKVAWETSEQSTINNLLREKGDEISWEYLPPRYYTHGLYTEGIENYSDKDQSGLWWENKSHKEKMNVFVPDDLLVHHANWCHGVDQKIDVLNFINEKIEYRKKKFKMAHPKIPQRRR